MDITSEILKIIGQPESETLEYKAVLPPSRILGQIISAFANSNGGFIILGIVQSPSGLISNGLSADFKATNVTQRAIEMIKPLPTVRHGYIIYKDKPLYVIQVEKSGETTTIEGKIYKRINKNTIIQSPVKAELNEGTYKRIFDVGKSIDGFRKSSSSSKIKFLEQYYSVLNILADLKNVLYPETPTKPTTSSEGKVLMRILFSSCADNFEIYLSDLLYEIYLANPATLKSNQPVTIKEVLDCNDINEFVIYWAKKKLGKLQRGSVKAFVVENKQLSDLNVLDETHQNNIEKILQIRHLYSHRNGIVDEKFLQFFPSSYKLNDQHELSLDSLLDNMSYLVSMVHKIDTEAIKKYLLATLD